MNHFLHRHIPIGITLILGTELSIIAATFVERWDSSNSQIQFQTRLGNLFSQSVAAVVLHVLETFYHSSNVGEVVGTGLGLVVVKTCVELHQGQLAITSQVRQEATVTVQVPLESVQ